MNSKTKYRILMSSIDALGHVNCTLALGEILASYGHQITFTNHVHYKKLAEKRNFKFIPFDAKLYENVQPASAPEWLDHFLHKFRADALSIFKDWTPEEIEIFGSIVNVYERNTSALKAIFKENANNFDLFIGDFIMKQPAFHGAPFPCAILLSMNPLPLYPNGPPAWSGFSVKDTDTEKWNQFRELFGVASKAYRENIRCGNKFPPFFEKGLTFFQRERNCFNAFKVIDFDRADFDAYYKSSIRPKDQNVESLQANQRSRRKLIPTPNIYSWWRSNGLPFPAIQDERIENWFYGEPEQLGIYHYPELLDYHEIGPMRSDKWIRLDCAIRRPDNVEPFVIPESLKHLPGKLVYFSLGSCGSIQIDLMQSFIKILSKCPHCFIVSKGPKGDELELGPNMWGENYVNQIAILDVVDLVITHGGNNTFLETIYAGKPLIVIPFFMDQLDNAQRAVDCGIGSRINLHEIDEVKVLKIIDETLSNPSYAEKIAKISASMKSPKNRDDVVKKIEKFIENHQK